ncbi:MAG: hypothetical protein PUC06_03630 [Oscillospiraceae bacterium]|nr:hypothetical protein [Oscillospiraceae bacterium]
MTLLAMTHFLVDACCASAMYHGVGGAFWVLIYNTVAFTGQALWGFLADRFRIQKYGTAISCLLVLLGGMMPLPLPFRAILLGCGNCGFHVGGGTAVLRKSNGKASALGVFVSPGCVGLVVGMLFPAACPWLCIGLGLCGILILLLKEQPVSRGDNKSEPVPFWLPLMLLCAIAIRSFGGFAVEQPWKIGLFWSLAAVLAVFFGKLLGGYFMDRMGVRKSVLLSLPPAAVLCGFFSMWAAPAMVGQFLLNLTMPVTLFLLYRSMPERPALSFGLAAAALWPGAIGARLIVLPEMGKSIILCLSFLLGLAAILTADRVLRKGTWKCTPEKAE